MSRSPRCHECKHPGGSRRRLHANRKPCGCSCHQPKEKPSTVDPIPIENDRTLTRGVNAIHEVRPESEGSADE